MDGRVQCQPDYADAIAYALGRLRTELSPVVTYHNLAHTEEDVLPAAAHLARLAGKPESDIRLLEVAAAFHDLGFIQTYLNHEGIGIGILQEVLPGMGFSKEEIARIAAMIEATRMPQTPTDDLAALLADADLDSLGREDFFAKSQALWRERAALGLLVLWPDWLETQRHFLETHRYFTPVAASLRDEGKRRNIALLEDLIRAERVPGPAAE